MDRRILPIPGPPPHDRHLPYRTLAPEVLVREHHCTDDDRQAGWMRARKDCKPTTKIPISLRHEPRRQDSFIPKNERVRQRPFDEALRTELEWMSQNWKTYWSQPFSSSSSSSQQWWQHEHQDSQWREQQDTQWRDHQWRDHKWWKE